LPIDRSPPSIPGMTYPRPRLIAFTVAAALVATALLGCGLLASAKNVIKNASTLSDLAEKITKSETATYQADYLESDGSTVTVAQQPPSSAYVSSTGRFITTADFVYLCDTENGQMVCQKSANTSGSTPDSQDATLAAGVLGAGFVSGPLALVVLTAAILVPTAKVAKSTKTIAGQSSTCAEVTNLQAAQSGPADQTLSDFTVCVTDASGVLSRFAGTLADGTKADITLTKYSSSVDQTLFAPPPGATVTDVDTLGSTPTPTGGASPSASS
jgi:hypothetical protein